MAEKLDCVVVGAGVIGLAVGRALAQAGRDVVVLESESQIGMHTSSRNSEVIHAGIYYPEDSLKARLCVQGREMLYAYCRERGISYKRLGKIIVAPKGDNLNALAEIRERALRCGVADLAFLSVDEVRKLEPEVDCGGGLLSPSTGIIDSHGLMMALQADIEAQRGAVVLNSAVKNVEVAANGLRFESAGETFTCETLVNSAGLWAQELIATLPAKQIPQRHLAKAHYFAYQGKSPFNHLVYPLPSGGGLGIHATNDLSGAARFGPDITWIDSVDYDFDESRKPAFLEAIRSYFPGVDAQKLAPAYTGIRPKLAGKGAQFTDFNIQFSDDHGIYGLINLFGIESPGLTASLAIGAYVSQRCA